MADPLIGQLLLQFTLILLNAVFACAEISVISLNKAVVQKQAESGDKKSLRLVKLLAEPTKFLATIQIGITLAGFLGSAFAADNLAGRLTNRLVDAGVTIPPSTLNTIAVIATTLVLSYFTLVFGELVPKRIAMRYSQNLASALSTLIYFISKLATPLVSFLNLTTNGVLRLFGINPHEAAARVTEEEIRAMVDAGSQSGTIAPEEREMIENIFEFNNKTVDEIMVHRTDVDVLWMDDDLSAWEATFIGCSHSFLPVCGESVDDIQGTMAVKDFFIGLREGVATIEEMMKRIHAPYYIPQYVTVDVLFKTIQKSKKRFIYVLDEYGGLSGIVTINDVLEEIVGEFDDGDEEEEITSIGENLWRIKGTTPLEDINEEIGAQYPMDDDFDTLGGLIISELRSIPSDANVPPIEAYGTRIVVEEVQSRRIEWTTVELLKAGEPVKEDGNN